MVLINNWLRVYSAGRIKNEEIYVPYTGKEIKEMLGTDERLGEFSEIVAYYSGYTVGNFDGAVKDGYGILDIQGT
jgi:hypothetical protein